jgi:UDP-glucose 4-epimerase
VKKVLITGGRGLLGSYLVQLLEKRWELFAVDRDGTSTPGATPIGMDLSRPLDIDTLPPRIDAVVHLAQSSRFRDFPETALDIFEVNLARLAELLDYARCAGASHFVHASTGGVYRRSKSPLAEEAATAAPEAIGYYAATKLAGEMLAHSYAPELTVVSLRYFFIYGGSQKRDMLIPRLVDQVATGSPVTLNGTEGLRLNPVHAADAAAATAAALGLDRSAIVNVAGPETLSIRDMAQAVGGTIGVEPRFEQTEAQGGDLIADTTRMRTLLLTPTRRFCDQLNELL